MVHRLWHLAVYAYNQLRSGHIDQVIRDLMRLLVAKIIYNFI